MIANISDLEKRRRDLLINVPRLRSHQDRRALNFIFIALRRFLMLPHLYECITTGTQAFLSEFLGWFTFRVFQRFVIILNLLDLALLNLGEKRQCRSLRMNHEILSHSLFLDKTVRLGLFDDIIMISIWLECILYLVKVHLLDRSNWVFFIFLLLYWYYLNRMNHP